MKTLMLMLVTFVLAKDGIFAQEVALANNASFNKNLSNAPEKMSSFNFEVYVSIPDEMKNVSSDMAGTHFLGDQIAKKVYLFEQSYTYTVDIAPGNPAKRTMFQKPLIYNSVRKIERLLKKSVKRNEMSLDNAATKFSKVLDVAISIKGLDTEKFEETIKSNQDPSVLLALFTQQVHLNHPN